MHKLKLRTFLFNFQQGLCFLCGKAMDRQNVRGRKHLFATKDHVHPKARGGTLNGNSLLAHEVCNNRKKDRAPRPCEILYSHFAHVAWTFANPARPRHLKWQSNGRKLSQILSHQACH